MPKKSGKKKYKATKANSYVEIISKTEIIYEDTKAITGAKHEFKLGEIYHMIRDQNVLDAGLEDMNLYASIQNLGINKVTTRPELFLCAKVIGWILPWTDPSMTIVSNIEGEYFSSFTLTCIVRACKLPTP